MEKMKDIFGVVALAFNATQINTILGLALTIINLLIVLINYGYKIYHHIKNGKIDKALEELEELSQEIEDKKEDINSGKK